MGSLLYLIARAFRAAKRIILGKIATTYYRIVCREFGLGSHVAWGTWMSFPEKVRIGKNVYIGRDCLFSSETASGYLTLEDGVKINSDVLIDFSGGVLVKMDAFISEGVVVYSHTHGRDPRAEATWVKKEIGEKTWIGAQAIVMHSCEAIGRDSIIGVSSVVTKNVNARSTVVGAAARTLTSMSDAG